MLITCLMDYNILSLQRNRIEVVTSQLNKTNERTVLNLNFIKSSLSSLTTMIIY